MGNYYKIIRGAILSKTEFRRCIVISSIIALIFLIAALIFCVAMFDRYSMPNDDSTYMSKGTVADVYFAVGSNSVWIEMVDSERLQLVYPWFARELYTTIGYDLNELSELLEGKSIKFRRMKEVPWIVEIYVDDIVIDNNKLTCEQTTATHACIVIIGIMTIIVVAIIYIWYLKDKYTLFKRAEKKRVKKLKRSLKLSEK